MSLERFKEIKEKLKTEVSFIKGVVVEDSKIGSLLNVLSYHYCLLEGKLNHIYNNQFIDSVNNESDLVSICQLLGVRRRSKVPNFAYLPNASSKRDEIYTASKNSVTYNFRSLKTNSNFFYEGSIFEWDNVESTSNNFSYLLVNSSNLYVHSESLEVKLEGVSLTMADKVEHFGNPLYYHIYENSDGLYTIKVFAQGTLSISGFLVGSYESYGITQFTKGNQVSEYASGSFGYKDKESIEEAKTSIPAQIHSNYRAVTISDYNSLGDTHFPNLGLYFYNSNRAGLIYFSNKSNVNLSFSEQSLVINKFKNDFAIPGMNLEYKKVAPILWKIALEILISNSNYQGQVSAYIANIFDANPSNMSLYKLCQMIYDEFPNIVIDVKINHSSILIPVQNSKVFNLKNIRGNISVSPYINYKMEENKIIFPIEFNGKIKVSNVLSPITFQKSDYLDYQYNIKYTT